MRRDNPAASVFDENNQRRFAGNPACADFRPADNSGVDHDRRVSRD
jgi:hypothetical protein